MSIYVIADLHLSFNTDKPMDIFGQNWVGHEEKIKNDWINKVKEDDLVVLPGDFSWSMHLMEADKDFEYINKLPGKKILLKGNHDYWWSTLASMRKFIKDNNFNDIDFLYNNSFEFDGFILCGTRGWTLTDEENQSKIISREIQRLELSLIDGRKKYGEDKEIIVFMHYPPITHTTMLNDTKDFIKIMKKYNVKRCYYGHLHAASINDAIQGEVEGIDFRLISADNLDFKLEKVF